MFAGATSIPARPVEVDGRRGLADATLLIRDRDHLGHRGITSNLNDGDDVGTVDAGWDGRDATPPVRWADGEVIHRRRELFTFLWICRPDEIRSNSRNQRRSRNDRTPV